MAAAGAILVAHHGAAAGKMPPGRHDGGARRGRREVHPLAGREPAFKGYRGFPGSICASPNSMVVHGIPGPYELEPRRRPLGRHRRDLRRLGRRRRHARSRSATSRRSRSSCSTSRARPLFDARRAVPRRATASATSRTPSSSRVEARRASRRSARWSATASAATCTRTRRSPTSASPARAPSSRRAWSSRSSRWSTPARHDGPHGRRRLGGLLPGRLARRPLRVHGRGHRGRPPHPHPLAPGAERAALRLNRSAGTWRACYLLRLALEPISWARAPVFVCPIRSSPDHGAYEGTSLSQADVREVQDHPPRRCGAVICQNPRHKQRQG